MQRKRYLIKNQSQESIAKSKFLKNKYQIFHNENKYSFWLSCNNITFYKII